MYLNKTIVRVLIFLALLLPVACGSDKDGTAGNALPSPNVNCGGNECI